VLKPVGNPPVVRNCICSPAEKVFVAEIDADPLVKVATEGAPVLVKSGGVLGPPLTYSEPVVQVPVKVTTGVPPFTV